MPDSTDLDKINGDFKGKDIISLQQFSATDIYTLFSFVPEMKDIALYSRSCDLLKGNLVTLLFYEPSSRTFGSFGASVKQLGGQTIDILNPHVFSSVAKGETLEDTVRVFESYSDAIVIRHPEAGTAAKAAKAANFVPIINAGDGIGEHPTQTLLDLYTIHERFGKLSGLTGLLAGDVKNSRTIHSLIEGLSLFENNTLYLLSPHSLKLPADEIERYKKSNITLVEITSESDIPKDADFWYWTRVQKERFENESEYEKLKYQFVVTPKLMAEYAKQDMILMDPLPRIKTIETSIDEDKRAVYLRSQIRNGMYVRMTLLALLLGKL